MNTELPPQPEENIDVDAQVSILQSPQIPEPSRLQAFALIIRHYKDPLLQSVKQRTPSLEIAQEVVQDAFMDVWNNIHNFRPDKSSFASWLGRIASGDSKDALRKYYSRPQSANIDVETIIDARLPQNDPADLYQTKEATRQYLDDINKLQSRRERQVLILDAIGFSNSEAAKKLGIAMGTFKRTLHVARGKLAQMLEQGE